MKILNLGTSTKVIKEPKCITTTNLGRYSDGWNDNARILTKEEFINHLKKKKMKILLVNRY